MWWVVVYVQVMGAWTADGVRKWKESCDWKDTKVLAVPIALTLIVKINCSAILALLCYGWWFQYVVGCGVCLSHGGLEGWWRQVEDKSCDWSDTKVLAVPITLTLIVKLNCSAILALLSCCWWFQYVVGCGLWMSHGGLEGWWRQVEDKNCDWSVEWYEGFGSSNCIDFDSQDELQCNYGPTLLWLMISIRGGL
jgi:hypothetical protein